MAQLFYGRSSSASQDSGLQLQIDRAKSLGIDARFIFSELKSGKDTKRPALQKLLATMRKGDVVIVTKLDRLARSVSDLKSVVRSLENAGVDFKVLDQPIDTTTAHGRLFFHMVSAFAEFERDLINDRAREGREKHLSKLRSKGLKPGPAPKLTSAVITKVKKLRGDGLVVRAICDETGLSRASVNRALATD
jgi:DNA invertase Pin-like site-specific DNA recombinase